MFSHNVGVCLPTRMLGVMAAVALFALASLACGLSQGMVQLILARGVQG